MYQNNGDSTQDITLVYYMNITFFIGHILFR